MNNPSEIFLQELARLAELREAYATMGGMSLFEASQLQSQLDRQSQDEFEQRCRDLPDDANDEARRIRSEVDAAAGREFTTRFVFPFSSRLGKEQQLDDVLDVTPHNIVLECSSSYRACFYDGTERN